MTDDASRGHREPIPDDGAGSGIVRASVGGTTLFSVIAVLAVAFEAVVPAFVVVSLVFFAGGSVACVVAFLRAVDRSRTETISVAGLFFGAGSAPRRIQVLLLASLGVEVVVAITAAALRPYTSLAFGTLAPMWALGLAGLWVARHGRFPAREPELTRAGRRDAERAAHRRAAATRRAAPDADTEDDPAAPEGSAGEGPAAAGRPGDGE